MSIRISAAQRDALYEQLLDHLSGIGDVWRSIVAENFDDATRLGREHSDDLRLILEDLGWGDGPGRSIELTTPPDVLRRVFGRLRDVSASQRLSEESEWLEMEERKERNRLVAEVCDAVLRDLQPE